MFSVRSVYKASLYILVESKLFYHNKSDKLENKQSIYELEQGNVQQLNEEVEQNQLLNKPFNESSINAVKTVHSLKHGVSPSKKFVYWAFRRLKELPCNEYNYYRSLLRQEILSKEYINEPFEAFFFVVEGYRKVKWVLEKFNIPFDEKLIPSPYNNFWVNSTEEERAWVFYRSEALKEWQSEHRIYSTSMKEEQESVLENNLISEFTDYYIDRTFGIDRSSDIDRYSKDLPLPFEDDVKDDCLHLSDTDEIFSRMENAKIHNPLLLSRHHSSSNIDKGKSCYAAEDMFDFEDYDDE